MIETLPNNNQLINSKNRYSALKLIVFPLIGLIFIVFIFAVVLFNQISSDQQPLLNWVNISIIITSVLLFIPSLFLLLLILGSILVMKKSRQPLYLGLLKAQKLVFKITKIFTNILNLILKPIILLESALIFFRKPKM